MRYGSLKNGGKFECVGGRRDEVQWFLLSKGNSNALAWGVSILLHRSWLSWRDNTVLMSEVQLLGCKEFSNPYTCAIDADVQDEIILFVAVNKLELVIH